MARRSKYARRKREKAYLAWLKTQPCIVCRTRFNIEAAHTTAPGQKAMSQKGPDDQALPMCTDDHRLNPTSHHRAGKSFWGLHGLDRDALIAEHRRRYSATAT